jgi:prepilin-type N-terminal cleavage/methylation domain-containing protein
VNRKRAFTLIELLVVIAIIAILAAILFPVFAQAKLQAKKAASISNTKQIGLSQLMYENDYDDEFVESTEDYNDSQCGPSAASGTFTCYHNFATAKPCWDMLLLPYIKTLGLFVEPGTGDPSGIFGSGPASIEANWNLSAQYGYNYTFLSPLPLSGLTGGGTLPSGYHVQIFGLGRSSTAAVNPAGLVVFVGDQGFPVESGPVLPASASYAYNAALDYDFLVPPGVCFQLTAAPDRLYFVGATGGDNWASCWTGITPFGVPTTGNTRVYSPYQGGIVSFGDGHSKVMQAAALAAGTDFGSSTTTEGTEYGSGTGSTVTNINAYMWTLDGTLTDVN